MKIERLLNTGFQYKKYREKQEWQYDVVSKPLASCSSRLPALQVASGPGRWSCERCCTIISDSTLDKVAGADRVYHGGIAVSV